MARRLFDSHPTTVAVIEPGIDGRIAIEHLAPLPGKRHANTIGLMGIGVKFSTISTDRPSFLL
ncbi:hypothetical protein PS726_05466 [Pseudomonas fluorescens]|nr:hypothetical protein PS861_04696 [Pseudomonas fluorescens]VVO37206.1 hypothetical protein PS726_05466 [Pseudomonas fluorescens]